MLSFWSFGKKAKEETEKELNKNVEPESCDIVPRLINLAASELRTVAANTAVSLETQLKQSLNRFFSTIDSVPDIIIIKDGDGKWNTVNRAGQVALQMFNNEYVGKTDDEVLSTRGQRVKQVMSDEEIWSSGQSQRMAQVIVDYEGVARYLDVSKTPVFNEDGSRKEMIIITRDMTEQRAEHKRMAACFAALNSASDPIVILDKKGIVFFANDTFHEMFKHKASNFVGKNIEDTFPEFKKFDEMWDVVRRNQNWSTYLGSIKKNVHVHPIKNGEPSPIYYICTLKYKLNDKYM